MKYSSLLSDDMGSVDITSICNGYINELESSIDTTKLYSSLLQGTRNPFLSFGNGAGMFDL